MRTFGVCGQKDSGNEQYYHEHVKHVRNIAIEFTVYSKYHRAQKQCSGNPNNLFAMVCRKIKNLGIVVVVTSSIDCAPTYKNKD